MTAPDRIQITHQPRTMTTPTIRAELQRLVQAYDEHGGRWGGHHERVLSDAVEAARTALQAEPEGRCGPSETDLYDLAAEFNGDPVPAMRRALELWGNPLQGAPAPAAPATPPAPEPGEGPTLTDVDELCAEFGFNYDNDQGETLEMLRDMIFASLTRWGPPSAAAPAPGENLATLPAPQAGEVGEVAQWLLSMRELAGEHNPEERRQFTRAATMLQQQEDELDALRGVPVAVSERLRVVKAGIRAGYNLGHHHTVEGGWGDPDEVADDIAQETLDDIGLPPAPQCLIARMADELDRLQPLPAFPPITSHPLAIEARALLRGGTTTSPAPQAGEVEA
jgi:hypothetical protein